VECSVLLKNAVEKKIDTLHIPKNALDVLSQQILGAAIEQVWDEKKLFKLIKNTYPYKDLTKKEYDGILSYLAGEYVELEDRYVYAKIWRKDGQIGKRGKMTRIIYMTNIGTIPSQGGIKVKLGTQIIGMLDESFLEKLRKRDIFVLGGATYEFRYTRNMTAVVDVSIGKPPTVPSWISEMLPLSFDLASDIGRFRGLVDERLKKKRSKAEILKFINEYLYVDGSAAAAIYTYLKEQYDYSIMPSNKRLVIEHYKDERGKKIIFHSLYGRRVNDCLSRAVAYVISKYEKIDVEIGITDNGFYIGTEKPINIKEIFKVLTTSNLHEIMDMAIDKTEVLKRRFRHAAERSLMILRNYKGRIKRAGRQQMASTILINAVNRISHDFPILKEARREVLEDLMDINNTELVLENIKAGKITIEEVDTKIPSPFAFQLVLQGYTDVLKIDDKFDFLKRMHELVLAKISLDKGKKGESVDFTLPEINLNADPVRDFKDYCSHIVHRGKKNQKKLAKQLLDLEDKIPVQAKLEMAKAINDEKFDTTILDKIRRFKSFVRKKWPKDLGEFFIDKAEETFSYEKAWGEHKDEVEKNNEELFKNMLMEQFHDIHKKIDLDPLIYFELEKFIENPKNIFDKKFKKWINELLTPPLPKDWPKELMKYIKDNVNSVK